jgi:hypothetical protein
MAPTERMQHPLRTTLAALLALLTLALPASADETSDAFLATWKQVVEQPREAHATWNAYATKHPKHDLGQVAKVLAGAAMLRDGGDPAKAAPFFVLDGEGASPLRAQLTTTIKSMQARVKMAALGAKLKAYYAKRVEFPATLDELVAAKFAQADDLVDPFGQRFGYETKARKIAPNIPRQVYALTCVSLKLTDKDAAASLAGLTDAPKGVTLNSTDPAASQAYLKRQRPDGSIGPSQRTDVGQDIGGGVTLWAVYDGWALIGQHGVPKVLVKE